MATLHAGKIENAASKLETILLVPDCHRPYHDRRAWRLMLQVAREIRPSRVVVLGDFADFYTVSSHDKDPRRTIRLELEIESARRGLDSLEFIPHRYFCAGNHEYRLERYLMTKAPELFNLVNVQDLFELKKRGWHYTPYCESLRIGKVNFCHDVGDAGGHAHVRAREAFEGNIAIGHTHRMGIQYIGNASGKSRFGAMLGWLGDANSIDYMHRVKSKRYWQLGFGVGYMEHSGTIHVQPVPIVDYRCVVGSKLFEQPPISKKRVRLAA